MPAGRTATSANGHRRLPSADFDAGRFQYAARIDGFESEPVRKSSRDRECPLLAQEGGPADSDRAADRAGLQFLADPGDHPGVAALLELNDSVAVEALLAADTGRGRALLVASHGGGRAPGRDLDFLDCELERL